MKKLMNLRKLPKVKALIGDRKIIGRGMFSIVVDNGDDTVDKITLCEATYHSAFDYVVGIKNKHFPIYHSCEIIDLCDDGDYSENFYCGEYWRVYIMRMDKMFKLDKNNRKIAQFFIDEHYNINTGKSGRLSKHNQLDYFEKLMENENDVDLKEFYENIINFIACTDNISIDLHSGNFMQDKYGVLIFSDIFVYKKDLEILRRMNGF